MNKISVKTQRAWETVEFTAIANGYDAEVIELTINHEEANYVISSSCQDGLIEFKGDSKGQALVKLSAIEAAVKWINSEKF